MKKTILALLIQLFILSLHGQTLLKDADTDEVIPNAHILNDMGQIVGITGLDGIIRIFPEYTYYTDSVTFEHISYLPQRTTIKEINCKSYFSLHPEIRQLPEITVSTNINYDYTVIKGYYRSYQLNNRTPVYYSDGIIEYYVPLKEKGKIKYALHHNRSFKNNEYLNSEASRSISVSMKTAGIFNYAHYWIPYSDSDYRVFVEKNNNLPNYAIYNTKGDVAGKIIMNVEGNTTNLYVDCLAPDSVRTHALFGYTSIINQHLFSQRLHTLDISNANIASAESFKVWRQIDFKHKKDSDFVHIECIDEFYVIQTYRIEKKSIDKQKLSSNYTLLSSSDTNNYDWLNNPQYNIPPLNSSIQKQLHHSLKIF